MSSPAAITDQLLGQGPVMHSSHPMDSSRILLGLMTLSRQAERGNRARQGGDSLDGVISKGVLRSLLSALHFRDVATVRHARRTAILATSLADYLGWEGRPLKILEVAALLHDIGKIGVPDSILLKPGPLNPDEAELMALHYNIGIDVLQACRVDREVVEIVSQSNHRFHAMEGRRVGADIHQGARILRVADAYDSLATDQVYRAALPHEQIMKILNENIGTQFDGNIVCALGRYIEREGPPFSNDPNDFGRAGPLRAPVQVQDALEASSLCHIFSYLYLLESLYDGFYLVDSDLRFVVWNRGAEKLLGYPSQEMLNRVWTRRLMAYADRYGEPLSDRDVPLRAVVESGKPSTSEVRIQHWNGHWVSVEVQSVPLLDEHGQLQGVAEIFRDLSRAHKQPQGLQELKVAASRDALTNVANRGELETQLALALKEYNASDSAEPFSVIFLDVDHFKAFNDTYGHAVGDQVLVTVARLLQTETYSGELIGRYGGEEFVVLCPATTLDVAFKRAERLRLAIANTRLPELPDVQITASFGVTEVEPGDSVESILRRADKALYMAKESGRNRTCRLTNSDLVLRHRPKKQEGSRDDDPWSFRSTFAACTVADMVVYKLRGFVEETQAKLRNVTQGTAELQVGSCPLLKRWGSRPEKQPVLVHIEIGKTITRIGARGIPASRQVEIHVRITPIGRPKDAETFHRRARDVFRTLRSYFVA
ncbi:MAG: diguanylate cyclase [Planctomycetota bacterium]|nr:MAG: diguanylate cyclase [Planctomycetota bacterium]